VPPIVTGRGGRAWSRVRLYAPPARFDEPPLRTDPIEEFCSTRFPDHYTGLGVPADRWRAPGWAMRRTGMVVWRRPGSGLDDAVRQAFPNEAVTFQDASLSRRELIALGTRIWADSDALARQDVRSVRS
jgi:hypothetical protein